MTATREVILQVSARLDVEVGTPNFHARLIEPVERGPGPDKQASRSGGAVRAFNIIRWDGTAGSPLG